MKYLSLRLVLLPLLALVLGNSGAIAAEPAIIAVARAYIGSEAALNSVKTLHYYGELSIEGTESETPISVEIIFQKPYRQLSMIKSERGNEETGLDGYDGWQRVIAKDDASSWRLSLMSIPQIKSLRANVWENLSFFRGLESIGGEMKDMGQVEIDGVACQKLVFSHGAQASFTRYFDLKTGRLVLTETLRGEKITEEGTTEVNGVKFPKVLKTVTSRGDGETQTVTITFDRIVVNETIDTEVFGVPMLSSK